MLLDTDLTNISYFVLAGNSETLNIVDSTDINDYSWVLYIIPGNYCDWFGAHNYGSLNSLLLTFLLERNTAILGLHDEPSDNKTVLPLKKAVSYRDNISHHLESYISREYDSPVEGDFLVLRKDTEELLTPFTGVNTKIPLNNKNKDIAALLAICSSPCNTHGVLVGDTVAAKQLLGDGLERTRAILIDHLNVVSGPTSCPIDMCLPIIYSEYKANPTMLDIVQNQTVGKQATKEFFLLTSVVTTCCCMYAILELDHGYRGLDILDSERHPRHWSIDTATSSTKLPYRYPLLVHLLSKVSTRTTLTDRRLEHIADLLVSWGRDSLFSQISNLKLKSEHELSLFTKLPGICKSFFIQLYRLTCKGVIEMPPSSKYPRRSQASKLFLNTHTKYESSKTLKDYLNLSDLIIQSSLLQERNTLSKVWQACNMTPYDVISNQGDLPPVEVKGCLDRFALSQLWKWEIYKKRLDEWGDISVKLENGQVTTVNNIVETATLNLLNDLENLCNSDELYTIVDTNSVATMTDYYGFNNTILCLTKVAEKLVSRIKFKCVPLQHIDLTTIVSYHENIRHPATYKIISLVIQILSVELMTIYPSNTLSQESISARHSRNTANLAVKQYLQDILDSSRV